MWQTENNPGAAAVAEVTDTDDQGAAPAGARDRQHHVDGLLRQPVRSPPPALSGEGQCLLDGLGGSTAVAAAAGRGPAGPAGCAVRRVSDTGDSAAEGRGATGGSGEGEGGAEGAHARFLRLETTDMKFPGTKPRARA